MALTAATALSRQAVAKHLRALEDSGLVRGRRAGRDRLWELESTRLQEASGYLSRISAQWDLALERLRAFVEEPRS